MKEKLKIVLSYGENPLAELNQCVLDSANGLVIYIIDVL